MNRKAIWSCLEQCASPVHETGGGTWSFVLSNGTRLPVVARTDEDWLTLEAPVACKARPAWTWLEFNARLEGSAKVAARPDTGSLCLRSDIPLQEDVDLAVRVRDVCADFLFAADSIAGRPAEPDRNESPATATIDIASLCRDAGWLAVERDGGRFALDLGVTGRTELAMVEQLRDGAVGVSVELGPCGDLAPASSEAMAAFLLRSCGIVRMVRAVARNEASGRVARLETRVPSAPCATETGHALSALSVACALFGREAQALRDDRVARLYLTVGGRWGAKVWHGLEETWTR